MYKRSLMVETPDQGTFVHRSTKKKQQKHKRNPGNRRDCIHPDWSSVLHITIPIRLVTQVKFRMWDDCRSLDRTAALLPVCTAHAQAGTSGDTLTSYHATTE